jgi:hypothetical protein
MGMRCACGRFKSKSVEQCASCAQANADYTDIDIGIAVTNILCGVDAEAAIRNPFLACACRYGCDCEGKCRVYLNQRPKLLTLKAMEA